MIYEIEIDYSTSLTYVTLEDAERALEILFEGGMGKLTIKAKPIEEVAA